VESVRLAEDVKWRVLLNTVMNLLQSYKAGNLLTK
jgi:hypothetical protein